MPRVYSPKDEIDKYNAIAEKRGYKFFSPEAMKAHKDRYGDKKTPEIISEGRAEFDKFNAACKDINHADHPKAYDRFTRDFGSSEDKAKKHFEDEALRKNGRLREQWPARDSHYEKAVLKEIAPDKSADMARRHESATLNKVLAAKWDAVGYESDNEAINTFNREYGKRS